MDVASNTVKGESAGEEFILDGETSRFSFMLKYGISDYVEVDVVAPYVKHSHGRFDNFIQNWHDFLGLSNEEQKQFSPNNLHYYYKYKDKELINITDNTSGIGDIKLGISFDLSSFSFTRAREIIVRLGLKLPTGSAEQLLGSGAADYSLSIAANDDKLGYGNFISLFGQAGILLVGQSDLFSDVQKRFVFHGSAGFDWFYWDPVVLRTQLDVHSSFYESDIEHLGESSVQLTVGGTIWLSKDMSVDIGVSENMVTDSTPDVGLNLVFRSGFE